MTVEKPPLSVPVRSDASHATVLEKPRETYVSQQFQQRYAVHVGNGLRGAEIFRALARDEHLPALFLISDVSAIVNISREGLRSRRSRGQPPSWSKPTLSQIRYPREAVCDWLANACIKTKPNV